MTHELEGPGALLEQLFAAYNDHRTDAVAELYGPSAEHQDVATNRVTKGAHEIAAGVNRLLCSLPDAQWEVCNRVGDQDGAACRYILSGTLRADLGRFVAVGQRLSLPGAFFILAPAGKIDASHDFWDSRTLAAQLTAD